jgi:integrase
MGVTQYEKDGQTLFKLDVWLKQPNGTLERVRMLRIPTQEHAEMLEAKLKLEAFEGTFFQKRLEGGIRVEDCWKAWEPIACRKNASWRSDVIRARELVRILGQHRAAKLTRADVEMYREKRFSETTRRGGPPAPASIDREVSLLRRCLNYMVECGKLSRNPIAGIEMLNVPNTRDMVLRGNMLERILKAAPPAFGPLIEFDVECGLRKTELRYLRFEQIDFEQGCIRLNAKETKNRRPRTVYLTARALEILRETPRRLHSPYVFVNPDTGKPWNDIYKVFRRTCERAGLAGIWVHDLRRSFVTDARKSGVPESVIMKLSGHRTRSVFDRYNIIDEGDLKEAVERMDQARRRNASRQNVGRRG